MKQNHLKIRTALYFVGLFVMTIGIALSVKSNLGVSPVSSIPYTMTCVWGIEMGKATILFHIVLVLLQILLLRRKFKPAQLLQVLVGVVFGYFTTFCNYLKDMPTAYHVFISADMAAKAARVAGRDQVSEKAALAKIAKVDHERAVHCKHFTKTEWGNAKHYDLCIHSNDLGTEETASLIAGLFRRKMGL